MAKCPVCDTPGAYVGFNSIECRNKDCEHYKFEEKKNVCGCCGSEGHFSAECPTAQSSEYDESGPPPNYSGSPDGLTYSSPPPPDWHGD